MRLAAAGRIPSAKGLKRQAAFADRMASLRDLETDSIAAASRLQIKFLRFLVEQGVPAPQMSDAVPADVAAFLVAQDESGRTIVHESSCPWWGAPHAAAVGQCSCPVRAAASAVKTCWGKLQGCFRDVGLVSDWSPQEATGNPCASALVRRLIKLLQREQLQSGLKALQAGLFDQSVFRCIMDRVQGLWVAHRSAGRYALALQSAREALLYSILWETGLRASEAMRLLRQHIRQSSVSEKGGRPIAVWDLHIALTKTAAAASQARVIRIVDDGSQYSPINAWLVFNDAAGALGLEVEDGPVFRDLRSRDADDAPSWGHQCEWKDLSAAFKQHLLALGFADKTASLHSFHGSKGARDKELGVPPLVTCKAMDWSIEMYKRYTDGRTPVSLAARHALAKAPVKRPQRGRRGGLSR